MKHATLWLCVLTLCAPLGFADSKEDVETLIRTFKEKADLQREPFKPFQLTARVRVTITEPLEGTYVLYWANPELWREEIRLGDYHEITVRKGEQKWVDRNLDFPPYVVGQLRELVGLVRRSYLSPREKIKKVRRVNKETQLVCAEIEAASSHMSHEDCFDEASGLLRTTKTGGVQESKTKEYAEYQDFGAKQFPRLFRLREDAKQRLEVQVETLEAQGVDEAKCAGLPGKEPIRTCQNMKAPIVVDAPDPEYSSEARKANLEGESILWAQVGADGKIDSLAVVRPLGRGLDEKALSAVKKWKFTPALCGSVPVQSDVMIEVAFHLR